MPKSAFILGRTNGRITGNLGILEEYLTARGYQVALLLHPLDKDHKVTSTLSLDGRLTNYQRRSLGIFNLPGDFLLSVKLVLKARPTVFIGTTNFDTLPALICRALLRCPIGLILYYPRDYSENRYRNRILNSIYHAVEHLAVRFADKTISYTKRAEQKRIEHGLPPARSMLIPNIVSLPNPTFTAKNIRKDKFVYSGDVTQAHGLYEFLLTAGSLVSELTVIGSGPEWDHTIDLARSLGINVDARKGKDRDYAVRFLKDFDGIGLAPYNLSAGWTFYSSPLKVVEYISCGVPVLMSDIPEMAGEVVSRNLGVVYHDLQAVSIQRKLEQFSTNGYEQRSKAFYESRLASNLLPEALQ